MVESPEKRSACEKKSTRACNTKERSILIDSVSLLVTPNRTMVPQSSSQSERTLSTQESDQDRSNVQESVKSPRTTSAESPHLTAQLAPCKVLSRLAENPSADVTQVDIEGSESEQEIGGVECSKAHNMLMQFATTEEKLDVISLALERGCVKKPGGGCKVRNEALWKAIDDVT
ncbi:hypothetical protein ACEPPN_012510 [Leptodophora sp. 'Broadleaf-Isolate-01']